MAREIPTLIITFPTFNGSWDVYHKKQRNERSLQKISSRKAKTSFALIQQERFFDSSHD